MASSSAPRINAVVALRDAFGTYTRHTAVVITVSAVLQLAQLVLTFVLLNAFGLVGFLPVAMATVVFTQLSYGVYTWLLLELRDGTVPSAGALLRTMASKLPALIWLSILYSVGLGVAFLLLVLPGIYLGTRWVVAGPTLVAGRMRGSGALRASYDMTGKAFLSAFLVMLMAGLVSQGTGWITEQIAGPFAAIETIFIVQAAVMVVIAPLYALTVAHFFFQLADDALHGTTPQPMWRPGQPVPGPGATAPSGPYVPVPAPMQQPAQAPYAAAPPAYAPVPGAPPGFPPPIPVQGAPAPVAQHPHPAQPMPAAPQPYVPPGVPQAFVPPGPPMPAGQRPPAAPPRPAPPAPNPNRTQSVAPPGMR